MSSTSRHKFPAILMLGSLLIVIDTQLANTYQLARLTGSAAELVDQLILKYPNYSSTSFNSRQAPFDNLYGASEANESNADALDSPSSSLAVVEQQDEVVSKDRHNFDEMQPEEKEISDELRRHYERDPILRHLTNRKRHDMPALKSSYNEEDEKHLEASYNYFYIQDELHMKHRVSDFGLMALVSKVQSMVYSDIYNHRYDSFQDLRLAAGPSVDNDKCIKQLESLNERADRQAVEKYHSKDINLYQLLDTWGHLNSGLFIGNAFFEGMYHECLRLKIRTPEGEQLPTRYCVASIKHNDWPRIDRYDVLSLKAGICLPKSCDSTNYKNKNALILKLLMKQLRPIEQGEIKFSGLYCLPDEDSPLRSIRNSPQSAITLVCLIGWVSLLVYCTYKHNKTSHSPGAAGSSSKFGLTNINAASYECAADTKGRPTERLSAYFRLYEMLSITNNLKLLFSTEKESSLMESSASAPAKPSASTTTTTAEADSVELEGGPKATRASQRNCGAKFVDLSCIEGIKVIAMTYVISGHVLMCITTLMQNGREMAGNQSVAFFLANLVPAFAVNAFFTITGMLTCYLMFKQNQALSFMSSPGKWAAFVVYRYLRIMPMYALAVLYCKTLAKYTGSGPLWDYATSSLGQRRACEQESWSVTLLFRSNFMPPLEHCIPGGWYLSNDFQFFLVTPFFLALLDKRPRLGLLVLYAATVAGYAAGFWSIMSAPVNDLKPIAMFAPHGFKTYVSHFSNNYTNPQYRIPAYLIGLIIGYKLFTFERAKIEHLEAKKRREEATEPADERLEEIPAADWSEGLKRRAMPICVSLVFGCCVTPVIGSNLTFSSAGARFMVAFITPSYHVMFALAVGLYLLLATTGYGSKHLNRFLSASVWKPLARLSLCAVLVNVEVINYIIQGNSNLHYITNQFHAALNLVCILATYAVSVVVCVLFEAPIRAALNTILTHAIKRVSMRKKKQKAN